MRRIFTLICCLLIPAAILTAQQAGSIRGTLIDSGSKEPIIGAVVEIYNTAAPDDRKAYTSAGNGLIAINNLTPGEYSVKISFLGYADITKTFSVGGSAAELGTLEMNEDRLRIDDVVLEVPAIRTSLKGDTVSYHAGAFKVARDADAEGLLAKMPGITVIGGTVEAQGEEVKKVFVDGREFFGSDVTTAIRSLPAEVVERVEVYNKQSDQSEFTGVDDGEGYKAINIVTALDKRSGQFGKLYGAYGYPDYYIAGANVNIFNGDSRLSVLGLFNNLNQQNFSFEDIVGATTTSGSSSQGGRMGGMGGGSAFNFMVRPQDGVATVQALGLNYSDKWGKNNKMDVTGSYFFNHTNTVNTNASESWFTNIQRGLTEYTESTQESEADNMNHRFNALLDYKISEGQNLRIRPSFSFQKYDNFADKFSTIENIVDDISSNIKKQHDITDSESYGYNTGIDLLYRTRLGKPGRTISVNLGGNYSLNNMRSYPQQYIFLPVGNLYGDDLSDENANQTNNQKIINDSYSYRLNGSATYTEPLSKKSSLNLEYRANYNYSDADRRIYLPLDPLSPMEREFNPEFDQFLSNISNSGYLTQRINPGYRYSGEKLNFNVNVTYQNATLRNRQEYPNDNRATHSFDNILYSGMLNYNIDRTNSLRINVSSRTSNPSISQLQNVVDSSNRSNIRSGNPNLVPSYENRLRAHYNKSNVTKGTTFMVMVGATLTENYIANNIVTDKDFPVPTLNESLGDGNRFTKPENMDGYWYAMLRTSFGFPVKVIKSNLNINLGGMLGRTPNMIDGEKMTTDMRNVDGGLTLSSNISENIDFTLSYTGSYNTTQNMSWVAAANSYEKMNSRYFMQYVTANVKWVFWKGVTFSANATYTQNKGLTEDYNDEYVICNALLGKKIFKNQRGELSLTVNDIFDQNKSFRTYINGNTKTNSSNIAIGRYVGLQFVYNLRIYGKGASRRSSDYDGLDQPSTRSGSQQRMGPGFGPGPGGPPPGVIR